VSVPDSSFSGMTSDFREAEGNSATNRLAAMPTGVALAELLSGLDVAEIRSDFELLEVVAAWHRVIAWASAHQLTATAEFVRRPVVIGPDPNAGFAARAPQGQVARSSADDEIAARLGISRIAAAARIDIAATLAGTLSATAQALAAGAIDMAKTRVIVEGCKGLAVDVAREVEAKVLLRASEQNCTRLKQSLRRSIIAADPSAAGDRCRRARADRKVIITALPDDMAEIYAVLPALQAIAIDTALTASARAVRANRAPGDARTMDQLRADALAAPFEAALTTGVLGGSAPTRLAKIRGARAQLQVTVPASVLLGISSAPGHLAGYGPITAETAREIAGDATWRRILTNPVDGTLLDVGTDTYRPPASLDRHVKTRDGTCRSVGCNWPAHLCELDHSTRYPEGATADDNLGPLCKRHHLFKHGDPSGRRLKQPSPGVFRWTMPTGHVYTVHAPALAPPVSEELSHDIARDVGYEPP
jgi:hypothetical protein